MSELIKRLRSKHCCTAETCNCDEAADEIERLQADAARYQFIRAGGAYIEPHEGGEIYMATDTGKYYTDMRDLDMDLDEAITAAKEREE